MSEIDFDAAKFLNEITITRSSDVNCEFEVTGKAMIYYIAKYPLYSNWKVFFDETKFGLVLGNEKRSADILTSIKHQINLVIPNISKDKKGYMIVQDILSGNLQADDKYKEIMPYIKLFSLVYYTIGNMMPIPQNGQYSGSAGDTAVHKIRIFKMLFDSKKELDKNTKGWKLVKEIYNKVFKENLKTEEDVLNKLKDGGYKIVWAKWISEYDGTWENFVDGNLLNDFVDENYEVKTFGDLGNDKGFNINIKSDEKIKKWFLINSKLIVERSFRILYYDKNNRNTNLSKDKNIFKKIIEEFANKTEIPECERTEEFYKII